MNDHNISANKPIKTSKIFLRVFLVVLVLCLATVISFIWAINSEVFAARALVFALNSASSNTLVITVEDVRGSIIDGLKVEKIIYKDSSAALNAVLEKLKINFKLLKLTKLSRIHAKIVAEKVSVVHGGIPEWVNDIPAFPTVSCFTALPGNISLEKVRIDKFIYQRSIVITLL